MGQVQSCECTSSVNLQSSGSWYHHFVTPWYPDLELHRFLIILVIILPSILDDLCFCSMICDSLVLKLIVAFLRNCQNKTLTIGFCSFSAMGNGLWLFSVGCMCWFSSPFLGSCIFFFFFYEMLPRLSYFGWKDCHNHYILWRIIWELRDIFLQIRFCKNVWNRKRNI